MASTTCKRIIASYSGAWMRKSNQMSHFRKRTFSCMCGLSRLQLNCLSKKLFPEYVKSSRGLAMINSTGVTLREAPDIQLPQNIRTNKCDPADHALQDAGLFYTVPEEDFALLCPEKGNKKGFRKKYLRETKAFNETALMVRKPALEVINYLKHSDYTNPVQRYLFYGDYGTGRSISLQHVTHYCLRQGWLLVPTLHAWDWIMFKAMYKFTQREELLESQWKPGRWDQPVRATAWLENFKIVNKRHLSKIKTSREYVWTKRERTEAGVPLGNLVDQGIARARISTDVIGCIMKELRTQPESNLPRVLVMVDEFNALFTDTLMKVRMGIQVENNQLSFFHNLKKMINNTWTNGAVLLATGLKTSADNAYSVLGHEAFDLLDPHIPVEVPCYSDKEVLSHMAYYEERKWLGGRALTADGKNEIIQLACNNPHELASICATLY